MKCPFCAHPDSQVVETRLAEEVDAVRRRRQCTACDRRFTTYERAEVAFPMVVKKDGRRVEYDRHKLRSSFLLALRKRPVEIRVLDVAIEDIEEKLINAGIKEISSSQMGQWVMDALMQMDSIAYIRFASVYRRFENLDDFQAFFNQVERRSNHER